ncbi:MAG: DNA polymerase I [Bacteroidetes bacterium]|nr:MAG: DNA polymerase I [Bacteroidota bacterium]HDN58689.1 DNA polymerase I [Candidatus Neomarinimicrobiota bacterium]
MEKKLFLLDAYALIFRAYYAFISNPMTNSKGIPTSTVFGFTLALEEVLRKENPTHIAVVFDPPGPNFRHHMFPEYKANRDATPEDIKTAVPYIKNLLGGFNIPVIEVPGYEADDTIGTMAKQAEKEGFTVYMMTPDKDFAQLVSERVMMYKPGRGGGAPEVLGPAEVREKFLVERSEQVIDILALMGDAADNIPGARGIGEKTAKKLIGEFKTVEGVYDNIDQLKGKQKENLENSKEQVLLSKELATISLDVPVQEVPSDLIRMELDRDKLESIFNELEFKNLAKRILGLSTLPLPAGNTRAKESHQAGPDGQTTLFGDPAGNEGVIQETSLEHIDSVKHHYRLINTKAGALELAKELSAKTSFCFDTETTGLDPLEAELVGIAFSWEAYRAVYIAFGEDREETLSWLEPLKEVFSNAGIEKVGQNLKYDLHILKNYDIDVKGILFDTMLAHFILKPEQKHNLNVLAEQYLNYSMVKIESLIGKKGTRQSSFRSVAPEQACEYAGEDADITWRLAEILKKEIKEQGFTELSEQIEMPLIPVLMEMEHHGVTLDVAALNHFAIKLREDILVTEKEIFSLAGMEFNISSPKQLGEVLFDRLKIVENPKKTKTRQYATGEEILIQLKEKHPIVGKMLEYRSLKKLLSTYVAALPLLVKPGTGKIHTSFNQALVTTGRLSSVNPNLQNIPIREERGREIRRAFIPKRPENIFFSADYSQIELRLMAHLSGDEQMINAFVNNEDIHTATAAKIYKVELSQVSKDMRARAKTANFGIIYGISAFGLSQRMHISRAEARELIDGYFESYPKVREFMDASIGRARENGFVETMFGRKRLLPDILSRNAVVRGNAERNAINSPIQGSAADIIKIAMIRIQQVFEKEQLKSALILQVHDELNFDVWPDELERVKEITRKEMEDAATLSVPLIVDMGEGGNWLEAH